jgi:hypothetical protein
MPLESQAANRPPNRVNSSADLTRVGIQRSAAAMVTPDRLKAALADTSLTWRSGWSGSSLLLKPLLL